MSFQAYLDTIEDKTGLTPRELIKLAEEKGLTRQPVQASAVIDWLKKDYSLGRGHSMAFVHVLKNGATIADTHVGAVGSHRDSSTELWLDGKASKPQ